MACRATPQTLFCRPLDRVCSTGSIGGTFAPHKGRPTVRAETQEPLNQNIRSSIRTVCLGELGYRHGCSDALRTHTHAVRVGDPDVATGDGEAVPEGRRQDGHRYGENEARVRRPGGSYLTRHPTALAKGLPRAGFGAASVGREEHGWL